MRQTFVFLTLLVPVSHLFAETGRDEVRFNEHIRPILAETCLACHGPDAEKREADLRLDIEGAAKKSALVPGDPERSELMKRVTSSDPDFRMPPDSEKALNGRQIELLRRWVEQGAE
ncbi:MAG: hypothetical protein N2C14_31885, partial [Planctomycetales bacterium]